MKLTVVAGALVALVLPLTPVAEAGATCAARGSVTVAATAGVRIYTQPKRNARGRIVAPGPEAGRTFACRYRSGVRVALGTTGDRILGSFHIAGNYVAFNASGHIPTTGTEVVEAVDLTRRKVIFRERVKQTGVSALVLSDVGSLAWIRTARDGSAVLAKYELGWGRTVVDPGPDIGRHSLALGGPTYDDLDAGTLYWTTPAGPQSAALRAPRRVA